jgi:tetratricopeptide (TPR) repeat protein
MEEHPMSITKKKHAAKGADILEGQYEEAIARIRQDGSADLDFSESTNLCIAYTKSGDMTSALESCDRAVDTARETNGMRWLAHTSAPYNVRRKDLDLVIALSNRSVVHAMSGDDLLALEDLREADALKPHLRAVSKNLAVLTESSAR